MSTLRLCAWIRSKSLYGRTFRDADDIDQALRRRDVPFSCLQTCQAWGPDDDLVEPGRCQQGRGCFELSPKNPRPTFS
jgi:hypothetical protein